MKLKIKATKEEGLFKKKITQIDGTLIAISSDKYSDYYWIIKEGEDTLTRLKNNWEIKIIEELE